MDDRLPLVPSHSNLIFLCQTLGLIPKDSTCLNSSNFYITNAVKCDMCSLTGKSGRVKINKDQAVKCIDQFLIHEILKVGARALVFFGENAQKFALGETTPLWAIRKRNIKQCEYLIMRVPHTSPTPFNTHGGKGHRYKDPFRELLCQAGIFIYTS